MTEQKTTGRKKAGFAILAVTGLIAAGGAGAGLNALFTDTQDTPTTEFTAGTISLDDNITSGNAGVEFSDTVKNIAAGDTTYRAFTLKNNGTIDIGRVDASLVASGELAGAGKSPKPVSVTQVNGDTSVGNSNTPLEVTLQACAGGKWTLTKVGSNPDGSDKVNPSCAGTVVALTTGKEGSATFVKDNATSTSMGDMKTAVTSVLYNVRTEADDKNNAAGSKVAEAATFKPGDSINYLVSYHLPKSSKNEYQATSAKLDLKLTATQRDSQTSSANTDVPTAGSLTNVGK